MQPHIHLDKVRTGPLLGPNRSGTLAEAIALSHAVKRAATVEEIRERAGEVIRAAVIAGTTAIRSHVDVDTIGGLKGLRGVAAARDDHADLCEIQLVAFPQEGIWRDPGTDELMAEAMTEGADVVGGMPHWEDGLDEARRHIEFCLDLARRHDADVDMHVDETDDPYWRSFEILVEEAERRDWGPRTTAGHVCAMASWEDDYAASVIHRAAAAGVMVATNPPTNLMLQGRGDFEPRRRGIPRVKELLNAGVIVAAGQDCVDDAFYPFGNADPLQVALITAHAAQLGTPDQIAAALRMVTDDAARLLRLPDYGLAAGRTRRPRRARRGDRARRAARAGAAPLGPARRPGGGRDRARAAAGAMTDTPTRILEAAWALVIERETVDVTVARDRRRRVRLAPARLLPLRQPRRAADGDGAPPRRGERLRRRRSRRRGRCRPPRGSSTCCARGASTCRRSCPVARALEAALVTGDDGGSAWRQRMGELRAALRIAVDRVEGRWRPAGPSTRRPTGRGRGSSRRPGSTWSASAAGPRTSTPSARCARCSPSSAADVGTTSRRALCRSKAPFGSSSAPSPRA